MNSPAPWVSRGVAGAALVVLLLTGCTSDQQYARRTAAFPTPTGPPPPDYVEKALPVEDDYVYYPAYQVYYSAYRREYVYLEHGSWISRDKPPRLVKRDALAASPSVQLGFNDSPSLHHEAVAEEYPKHWKPTGETKGSQLDGKEENGSGHK